MKKRLACVLALAIIFAANFGGVIPGFVYADSVSYSAGSFAELLDIFDTLYGNGVGDVATVTLTADIEQTTGEGDYLGVSVDDEIILDLAGNTFALRNDGPRGIQNEGKLIVTGDGVITNYADNGEINGSYGLIDNYGGSVVIKNGTFLDYGQGGGATLKNRVVGVKNGVLTIESATIHGYGAAGGNACVVNNGTLTIFDGVVMENEATDEKYDGFIGAYCLINDSGSTVVGTTVGKNENPVRVTGNRGGMGVNSGEVVINNGVFRGEKYYGIWITNNGDVSNVDVKYVDSYGAKYGLYSSVDDGRQDLSNVGITVEGGKFAGGTRAAVAVNGSKSEHSFGMAITGGEFSSKPDDSYIVEGYVAGLTEDADYPYMVVSETDESDEYDVEYEEDEQTSENVPVIYPARVDYDDQEIKDESEDDGHVSVAVEFDKELIADRQATLSAVVAETEGLTLDGTKGGELIGAIDINMLDRNGEIIEVEDNELTIRINVDEETYNELAKYDKIEVIYFDNEGNEVERLDTELKHEDDRYWIEFKTSHLSTYGVVGVNEEESEEAAAPETGTVTAAGASAMSAALVTAVAVGILTSIASFTYLVNRKY